MKPLSIAYFTCRKEPLIELFLRSLKRELKGQYDGIHVIIIDFYCTNQERKDWLTRKIGDEDLGVLSIRHVPPKPCVWQGPHRLTVQDFFCASNARNTAFALCPDDFIACIDDLSVVMPGWLDQVRHAQEHNYVVLGAYKKVFDLACDKDGKVTYTHNPSGVDSRWGNGSDKGIVPAAGSWMFGCSFGVPMHFVLKVNGSDQHCDSQSAEDYDLGIRLQKAGATIRYNRNMLSLEDDIAHGAPGNAHFVRYKKEMNYNGKRIDSDHVMLQRVTNEARFETVDKHFNLKEVREKVLAGEPFPIPTTPTHDWRDGQPLNEIVGDSSSIFEKSKQK